MTEGSVHDDGRHESGDSEHTNDEPGEQTTRPYGPEDLPPSPDQQVTEQLPPQVYPAPGPNQTGQPLYAPPATPPTAALPRWLPPEALLSALRHAGVAVGFAIVLGLLQSALLFATGIGDMVGGNAAMAFLAVGSLVTSMAYGGTASVSTSGGLMEMADFSGGVHVFPIAISLLIVAATAVWGVAEGRRQTNPSRATTHAASGITAIVVTIVLVIWTLIFRLTVSVGFGGDARVSGMSVLMVLGALVLTYLGSWYGRLIGMVRAPLSATIHVARDKFQRIWSGLREVLTVILWGGAAFGIVTLIAGVIAGIVEGGIGTLLASVLLWIGNVTVMVAAIASLGAVDSTGDLFGMVSGSQSVAMWDTLPGWSWVLLLIAVVIVAGLAARVGLQRDPARLNDWTMAWVHPVAALIGWFLLPLLFVGVSVGVSGMGSGVGGVGASVALWVAPVMAVWAAALEVGARFLPRVVLSVGPQAARVIGGRYTHPVWLGYPAPGQSMPSQQTAAQTAQNPIESNQAAGQGPVPGYVPTPEPAGDVSPETGAATAPGPMQGSAYAPAPPAPMSAKAKKRWKIGGAIAAAAVVVIAGGIVGLNVVGNAYSPEAVAQKYLSAIADGKASAANDMVDPDVPNDARTLLTDDALAGQTERISNVRVEKADGDSDDETDGTNVDVSYKLDGVERTATLTLEKAGKTALVFDQWQVATPLVYPVMLGGPLAVNATFGDQAVELDTEGERQLYAYPGVYPVSVADSDYVTADELSVEVSPEAVEVEGTAGGWADLRPTDALTSEVQKQVEDEVSSCVTEADTLDLSDVCPFRASVYGGSDPKSVSWKVDSLPQIEIDVDENGLSFSTEREGELSVSYKRKRILSDEWEKEDDTESFSVSGTIEVEDGTVTVDMSESNSWW